MSVANSRGSPLQPPPAEEDGSGLGGQLIRAFAMQLDAAPMVEETPGAYRIAIRFRPSGFEEEDAPADDPRAAP